MKCNACDGTGDGVKFGDRNCSICEGSGCVCDVCGDAVDVGEDICIKCEDKSQLGIDTKSGEATT